MFSKILKRSLVAGAVIALAGAAVASSWMGPYTTWQVPALGYNPPIVGSLEMGGPMNLNEEYRWNVKTVYYAYDPSFIQYFGVQGTNAIEKAIAMVNAIPNVTQMSTNLDEFPLDTKRVNHTASALNLIDLKSFTLANLISHMGVASAERYTWCLRGRTVVPGPATNYVVIRRNFDPVTLNPSSYVNGALYTYVIEEFNNPDWTDASEVQVDPLQIGFTTVASGFEGLSGTLGSGEYYTGLTRDDMGALRHLYGKANPLEHWHVEDLPAGTTAQTSGSPWSIPGGTNNANTNAIVGAAVRPGVEHVEFKRANYDSLLGAFIPVTNKWTDTYVSNGVYYTQLVERVLDAPDLLFAADDLGLTPFGFPFLFSRTLADAWINNDPINGSTALFGPGVIAGPMIFTYSKLGPYYYNINPSFVDDGFGEYGAVQGTVWGSFDGTANDPIVFPSGSSIQDLKMQAIYGVSPWTIPNSGGSTNSAAAGGVAGGTSN